MVTSTGRPRPNCESFTFGQAIKTSGQIAAIRIAAQRSGQVATDIDKMWRFVSAAMGIGNHRIRLQHWIVFQLLICSIQLICASEHSGEGYGDGYGYGGSGGGGSGSLGSGGGGDGHFHHHTPTTYSEISKHVI